MFHMIWSHTVTCMFFFKSVISWRSWLWGMTVPGIRMWCSDPLVCGGATACTDSMTLKQVPFPLQHTDPKYTWTSLGRPFLWRRYRGQDARCKSQQTKHWIVRGSSEHWIRFFTVVRGYGSISWGDRVMGQLGYYGPTDKSRDLFRSAQPFNSEWQREALLPYSETGSVWL